jgi:hypothetical protein
MGRGKRHSGSHSAGAVLRPAADFNAGVSFDKADNSVTIHLPELNLLGHGADFEAAKADLIAEVRIYGQQFAASPALQGAPNRSDHARLLELIAAADAEGRLEEILFVSPAAVA